MTTTDFNTDLDLDFAARTAKSEQFSIHWSSDYKTTVICEINDGDMSFVGTAHCAPEDRFIYGVGQMIALTRALAGFGTDLLRCITDFTGLPASSILPVINGAADQRMVNKIEGPQ